MKINSIWKAGFKIPRVRLSKQLGSRHSKKQEWVAVGRREVTAQAVEGERETRRRRGSIVVCREHKG